MRDLDFEQLTSELKQYRVLSEGKVPEFFGLSDREEATGPDFLQLSDGNCVLIAHCVDTNDSLDQMIVFLGNKELFVRLAKNILQELKLD